jgi:hypothetical protein
MRGSSWSVQPGTVASGFVCLLLATAAAVLIWPFYSPLLWVLIALASLYFLFAIPVILFSIVIILRSIKQQLWPSIENRSSKESNQFGPPRGAGTEDRSLDLWDRWLDGE